MFLGGNTMKATLLLHDTDRHGNHWTAGDQEIEIRSSSNLANEVFEWMTENGLPRGFLRNVYYDGMLLEYTSKPVLREVSTGIEL